MLRVEQGTYLGELNGLQLEVRVERAQDRALTCISGDLRIEGGFVVSFLCESPQDAEPGLACGPVVFRGHPALFTGAIRLEIDERGIGVFQLDVDLEGGYTDRFVGPMRRLGGYYRRLTIEFDGIEGTRPPSFFVDGAGERVTVKSAYESAGFDVKVLENPFWGSGSEENRSRGWTLAEIHAAMEKRRALLPDDPLHVHVFVCSYLAGRDNRGVLGIMYDFGQDDLNERPREGVAIFHDHPMLSDPRIPEEARNREFVFTAVHEIGHALNMLHSFDKARPSSLSWMNYPDLYPLGHEAPHSHNGTDEFWSRFTESFDALERRHLRHATPREIEPGGLPFGSYEQGRPTRLSGESDPRRTYPGTNPLRATRRVELFVKPVKQFYALGEPVFLEVELRNRGAEPAWVPDALDPTEGYLRITIRRPNGDSVRYQPPVRLCKQVQVRRLPRDSAYAPGHGLPLFLDSRGPVFTDPGAYTITAELTGVNGSHVAFSSPHRLILTGPDKSTERFAEWLWGKPAALRAMYLRHPLVAQDPWSEMQEKIAKLALRDAPDNSTASYVDYVSALGWLAPFRKVDRPEDYEVDVQRAAEHMRRVKTEGLPRSIDARKERVLQAEPAEAPPRAFHVRRQDHARSAVAPGGLFGQVGLERQWDRERSPTSPFSRIVTTYAGGRRCADIVSWNIEHLHSQPHKIPQVAELMRSFRCDFWGLQEVDQEALEELVDTINSAGRIRYAAFSVPGSGQRNGALYRVDTTEVGLLPDEHQLFDGRLQVQLRNGDWAERDVFYRQPMLCAVRVSQGPNRHFDFRCAIVHLKSTDSKLKDAGNSLRLEGARRLVEWIRLDRAYNAERDYLVLGDMNAETMGQGLEPFVGEGMNLLSVDMRQTYGVTALTRPPSERLLDHIVVTDEAQVDMPSQDRDEQIIIRCDTRIEEFIQGYSDHIPVAVRMALAADDD